MTALYTCWHKWITTSLPAFLMFMMFPSFALAEDKTGSKSNPFTHMSGFFVLDFSLLDNLTFVQKLYAIGLTCIFIAMILKLFWDFGVWGLGLRKGKSSLKDTKFLVESGVTILLVILFSTGTLQEWLGSLYGFILQTDLK